MDFSVPIAFSGAVKNNPYEMDAAAKAVLMRLHLKAGLEAPPSHFFASGGTGQTLGGSKGTGINPEADNRNSEETEALSELWHRENDKSFGLGGRERGYQTEIRNVPGGFAGAVAHHRLIPGVRTMAHATNHWTRRGFTNHAAGEQRQRNRQQGDENDSSFDALHARELTIPMFQTRRRVCAEEGFAVG